MSRCWCKRQWAFSAAESERTKQAALREKQERLVASKAEQLDHTLYVSGAQSLTERAAYQVKAVKRALAARGGAVQPHQEQEAEQRDHMLRGKGQRDERIDIVYRECVRIVSLPFCSQTRTCFMVFA